MGELVPERPEPKSPAVARRDMRVSDDDRTAVTDELRIHFSHGRLDLAEFEDRVNAALASVTRGELDRLLDDLPYLRQPPSGPPIRERAHGQEARELRVHFYLWIVVSLFLSTIWAGTSASADGDIPFWPIYPIAAFGLTVGIHWAFRKGED